jgi:hypothetical protein
MDTKKCCACNQYLSFDKFGADKRTKHGLKSRCKNCQNEYDRMFYKEKYVEKKQQYSKKRYNKQKERLVEKSKEYYRNNAEKVKQYQKEYRKNNIKKILKTNSRYIKEKRRNDPAFVMQIFMRKQIHRILDNKTNRTKDILGYGKYDLLQSLGRMPNSDENIDHKIPISWFKKSTPASIVCDTRNLHIISASENFKKSNTYAHKVPKSYYDVCIKHIKLTKIDKVYYE